MLSSVIWTLVLLAGVALFALQIFRRLQPLLKARPTPGSRIDRVPDRIKHTLVYAFGQLKFFRGEQPAGLLHALVFWGFLVLTAQVLTMFLRGWVPEATLPLLGVHQLGGPYMLLRDIVEAVVFVCAFGLLVRWLFTHPVRLYGFRPAEEKLAGRSHWEAVLILIFIATITATGLVYDAGRLVFMAGAADIEAESAWQPMASIVSSFMASAAAPSAAETASNVAWWIHNLVVLTFLNLLPLSKHFHVITAIPNVFLSKLEPVGRLSKQDLETAEIYGTSRMVHFDWKQILDMYTCTECGRCSAMCPATSTDKPLAPRQLLLNLRDTLYEHPESMTDEDYSELVVGDNCIRDEVLWSCTTCRACEDACPVHIEYVDKIVDMRRHLVQEEARFPTELTRTFKGLETQGNPWGIGADKKSDWTEGLDIPLLSENPGAEYLFYVGCAGSFDDRAKKITVAVARILDAAGVSYAILGRDEPCNGDTARRLGNEYLYQSMAQVAVETFDGFKVKKVITNCPHCFNTIKNEFPQFGGEYEVVHAAELVAELIRDGKLSLDGGVAKSIVFHDSCYLGRYNEIYQAPRDILAAIPGVVLEEVERTRNTAMCCGAGGGRMWIEEEPTQRVNTLRVEQLLASKTDVIASACPYCMTMLDDGVKAKELEDKVRTRDVMELVADAIDRGQDATGATRENEEVGA
ncbi:MAG: (Fe-S)-binding protein [Candidatus Binatia bacterium]